MNDTQRDALLADIERIRFGMNVEREEAERSLLEYLSDADARVRTAAAEGVWEHYDLAPVLDKTMRMAREDADPEVRRAALTAMGRVMAEGDIDDIEERPIEDLDPEIDLDPKTYWKVREFLQAAAGDEAIPLNVRRYAVESLGYAGRHSDIEALLGEWYDRPEPEARRSAVFAMGLSRHRGFASRIQRHLGDPDLELRIAALRAAGFASIPQAKETLLAASRDADASVRAAAAEALGNFGGEDVLDRLGEMEDDPDEEVRRIAGDALDEAWDNEELGEEE